MLSDCVFNETRWRFLTFPPFQISARAETRHVIAKKFRPGERAEIRHEIGPLLYCEQLTFLMHLLKHEKNASLARQTVSFVACMTAPPSCCCTCKQIYFTNRCIKIYFSQRLLLFCVVPIVKTFHLFSLYFILLNRTDFQYL